MKEYTIPLALLFAMLMASSVSGCYVGDDLLWVAMSKTSWETKGVDLEFRAQENVTIFTFNGTGVFNNPNEEDYRIIHSDGCGFKAHITYTPNNTIEDPLEGVDYYPEACTEALMTVDNSHGRTEFELFGGIQFPGNITELPAGFYDISIYVPPSVEDEVSSINYMLLADGGLYVMLMRNYCGIGPETTPPASSEAAVVATIWILLPFAVLCIEIYSKKK